MLTYTFINYLYIPHSPSQYEHVNSRTIPLTHSATIKYFCHFIHNRLISYHLQFKNAYGKYIQTYLPLATDVHTYPIYRHILTQGKTYCMFVHLRPFIYTTYMVSAWCMYML